MTISQIVKSHEPGCACLIRYRKDSHSLTGTAQYDVKPLFTGSKKGWTVLDITTMSVMAKVYDAIKPELQPKFDNIPLGKLVEFCWQQVK